MNNQEIKEGTKEPQEELKQEDTKQEDTKPDGLENLEEKLEEPIEKAKDKLEEEKEESQEKLVEIPESKKTKSKNIYDELVSRVDATKEQAEAVYNKYLTLNRELEDKSSALVKQENSILNTTIANSLELLKELQVQSLEDENATINEIKIDNKEQLLNIKYPSKGRFGGFIFGTLAAIVGVAGAYIYGSKLANIPLTTNSVLARANWDNIALKYADLINVKGNVIAGYATITIASLALGAIVYKIFTFLQINKNKKYVNKLEEDLNEYVAKIKNKNDSIQKLIEHIDNIKLVMQKYDIILQEQNAKLKRILFIEQPQSVDDLQSASRLEVDKTVLILDELLKLMNTPVSEDITIRPESQEQLKEANALINEVIKKLYI